MKEKIADSSGTGVAGSGNNTIIPRRTQNWITSFKITIKLMLLGMKKSILLLLSVLSISSCVDQESSEIRFTIYNQTDKQVTVTGFSTYEMPNPKGIADPIVIAPKSSFTAIRVTGINDTIGMYYYSLHDGGVDSVRIVFEGKKLLVYASKEVAQNNPKAFSIIAGKLIKGNQFGHYITEEDYALAVDCGEECF